jgi:hypothetical protein
MLNFFDLSLFWKIGRMEEWKIGRMKKAEFGALPSALCA